MGLFQIDFVRVCNLVRWKRANVFARAKMYSWLQKREANEDDEH